MALMTYEWELGSFFGFGKGGEEGKRREVKLREVNETES